MAKRAAEPDTGHSEVVNLNNDARWQARLEEARARRAEALKLKGLDDKPKRAPRKPWEDEADTALEAEKHQRALDHEGLDFHDRMNALQKVLKDKRPETAPTSERQESMRNWSPEAEATPLERGADKPVASEPSAPRAPSAEKTAPPVDTLFNDPAFGAPEPETADLDEPEYVPLVALVDPLPRSRPEPPSRPWLDAIAEDDTSDTEAAVQSDVAIAKPKARSEGMPFLLGIGLVALVAMPFFHLLPPMVRGPQAPADPVFGLQPAFGITAAMVEFPTPTQSGEFVPLSAVAPGGPLALRDPRPPTFSRAIPSIAATPSTEVFVMPQVSGTVDADLTLFARSAVTPLAVTQAMLETQVLPRASAGLLPGVLATVAASSLTPEPRP